MSTNSPRLNVVLDKPLRSALAAIAKREAKSMSLIAKELLQEALDRHEDFWLSQMALRREQKSKKTISHDRAWK